MYKFDNLNLVIEKLNKLKNKKYKYKFSVPGLWLSKSPEPVEINPYDFCLTQIKLIKELSELKDLSSEKIIYNLFVRLTAAYDHNCDGSLSCVEGQFRETGTFLKAITILPYLKSLGVNTIYLLPVTSIGEDEKKGNLGSPYAIRNPYTQDVNLSEPLLDLDTETEFKAFSEAVHMLGMKLVCEFVFRTASVDSDLSLMHPDWFYWISNRIKNREKDETTEAKYGTPIFLKRELDTIKKQVAEGNFKELVPPHEQYRKMFTESQKKVARVDGRIRGLLADKKTEVRIPGAFADWPPDDNQPVWSDVTYLKLYEHPKFNYIAYNTVRMYDESFAKNEFRIADLWDYITGIIPHYIEQFDIDGVMIDMGHALPSDLRKRIVDTAKAKKENFFFWEENFTISEKSLLDGYSAVLGYMTFDAHRADKMRDLINRFVRRDFAVNFFATSENHNTPRSFARVSDVNYLKSVYTFSHFLPALTFIHSGFELAEIKPVNTGLDFDDEQIAEYSPDKLGLFSSSSINWDSTNEITEYIKLINKIKLNNISENDDIHSVEIQPIDTDNNNIIGFIRRDQINLTEIMILSNYSFSQQSNVKINSLAGAKSLVELLSNNIIEVEDGICYLEFEPYETKIFKLKN